MSENGEKYMPQFSRAQVDIYKCVVLSNQRYKIQRYSVYNYVKQRKAANPSHLRIWKQRMCDIFA